MDDEEHTAVSRLKQLNKLISQIDVERTKVKILLENATKQLQVLNEKVKPLRLEQSQLRMRTHEKGIGVSDHAVLQYLVRRDGLNLKELKTSIAQTIKPLLDESNLGVNSTKDFLIDGWVYRYDCGTNAIVTIIKDDGTFANKLNLPPGVVYSVG